MCTRIIKPAILSQEPDPLWDAEKKKSFEAHKRDAQVEYDRALMTPGQPVNADQCADLAAAIKRANEWHIVRHRQHRLYNDGS